MTWHATQSAAREREQLQALAGVPLTRMDHHDPELLDELLEAVRAVARTGAFILGAEVERFEEDFAAYCGTSRAVGVSSGIDALLLALRALGIGAGDEVVVPANSFIATAEAVTLAGARPVFADVDPVTQLVTPSTVAPVISERTAALIPVHLYGRTVDMDPLLELARARGLVVVEDACQAHGARYRGRRVGTLGAAGCFSFYPAKNLGAWGDGGALVTGDEGLAERVALMRSHGERPRYHHQVVGTTARLDAVQAAVLRCKLRQLDGWNDARRRLGAALAGALVGSSVRPPAEPAAEGDHVYHQFVVTSDARDGLRRHLESRGVATGIHYPVPIHRSPPYEGAGEARADLPVAESLADRVCSLPMFPAMTASELDQVVAAVISFVPSPEPVEVASQS